jgi:aldose 1-epimerase
LCRKWQRESSCAEPEAAITATEWGLDPLTNEPVTLYTLRNKTGMEVRVSTLGCQLCTVLVPVNGGAERRDVVLGYGRTQAERRDRAFGKENFGTIVGRYANRIRCGAFSLDGKKYTLPCNNGKNHLHGGPGGFFRRNFSVKAAQLGADGAPSLTLTYVSADGEEGYPGTLEVEMTYKLCATRPSLSMSFQAKLLDGPATPVNLTHHAYWNLAGHASQAHPVNTTHELWTPQCSRITVVDETLAATGETETFQEAGLPAYNSGFRDIDGALDHNICLDAPTADDMTCNGLRLAAWLREKVPNGVRGLGMRVWTDQPGVQAYAGGGINPENPQWQVPGKGGVLYQKCGAVCLETQLWPGAINHPEWGQKAVLRTGETYTHEAMYEFLSS